MTKKVKKYYDMYINIIHHFRDNVNHQILISLMQILLKIQKNVIEYHIANTQSNFGSITKKNIISTDLLFTIVNRLNKHHKLIAKLKSQIKKNTKTINKFNYFQESVSNYMSSNNIKISKYNKTSHNTLAKIKNIVPRTINVGITNMKNEIFVKYQGNCEFMVKNETGKIIFKNFSVSNYKITGSISILNDATKTVHHGIISKHPKKHVVYFTLSSRPLIPMYFKFRGILQLNINLEKM